MDDISKKIPTFDKLFNPLLKTMQDLGGSATIDEINEKVMESLNLPQEILDFPHGEDGGRTEIEYRLAWARTYLKKYGILENSSRGVWSLNKEYKTIKQIDSKEIVKKIREESISKSKSLTNDSEEMGSSIDSANELQDWKYEVIEILMTLDPSAFERLVQRFLRESGFTQVEVTGKSGDGGIDGKGILKLGGILSFHILFQCKRYKGSVSASSIRDFRGALQGRADKGLFVTTGNFTRDAVKEATRDGAPPIDLIDGDLFAEKLKEFSLGLNREIIEKIVIDKNWFKGI